MKRYPRTALASRLADELEGRATFGDARNGLFLAAPRRTGKSTFLRQDLAPELTGRGHTVLYVDLWADTRLDPADVVASEIARGLRRSVGPVGRATQEAGIVELNLGGVMKVDTTLIGRHDGLTLTDALRALCDVSSGRVVLMIDEAQHALTTEAGEAMMFALKAARDTINAPDDADLLLVMTGSDRDKLLRLVNTNAAPFLGSAIRDLPLLGEEFTTFVVDLVEADRKDLAPVDAKALDLAFRGFGHRPQLLETAIQEALSPLAERAGRFEGQVLARAGRRKLEEEARMRADYLGWRPLERTVVWRMLTAGRQFRPFDAESMRFYETALARFDASGEAVTTSRVQKALESLRNRTPPAVWKSARGEYAIDDVAMQRWYDGLVEAGRWPPEIASNEEPDW